MNDENNKHFVPYTIRAWDIMLLVKFKLYYESLVINIFNLFKNYILIFLWEVFFFLKCDLFVKICKINYKKI